MRIRVTVEDDSGAALYSGALRPSMTIASLKRVLRNYLRLAAGRPIWLNYRGEQLADDELLQELTEDVAGPHREEALKLVLRVDGEAMDTSAAATLEIVDEALMDETFAATVAGVRRALLRGARPELAFEGSGGTYFLRDTFRQKVLCFKPRDEEANAENNPRAFVGRTGRDMSLREGILSGEAAEREVAAFMLDHGRFAGVPVTLLARSRHEAYHNADGRVQRKTGSLQQFLDAEGGADDYGPGLFTVLNVQRIAQLDLRLLNTDRNGENLLVVGDSTQSAAQLRLVPIDHGYCLPDRLDLDFFTLHWRRWKQVKEPCLPEVEDYILCLDVDADALRLRDALHVREPCLMLLRIAGRVLKAAVQAGLTLAEAAEFMYRVGDGDRRSAMEDACHMALDVAQLRARRRTTTAASSRYAPDGGSLLRRSPDSIHGGGTVASDSPTLSGPSPGWPRDGRGESTSGLGEPVPLFSPLNGAVPLRRSSSALAPSTIWAPLQASGGTEKSLQPGDEGALRATSAGPLAALVDNESSSGAATDAAIGHAVRGHWTPDVAPLRRLTVSISRPFRTPQTCSDAEHGCLSVYHGNGADEGKDELMSLVDAGGRPISWIRTRIDPDPSVAGQSSHGSAETTASVSDDRGRSRRSRAGRHLHRVGHLRGEKETGRMQQCKHIAERATSARKEVHADSEHSSSRGAVTTPGGGGGTSDGVVAGAYTWRVPAWEAAMECAGLDPTRGGVAAGPAGVWGMAAGALADLGLSTAAGYMWATMQRIDSGERDAGPGAVHHDSGSDSAASLIDLSAPTGEGLDFEQPGVARVHRERQTAADAALRRRDVAASTQRALEELHAQVADGNAQGQAERKRVKRRQGTGWSRKGGAELVWLQRTASYEPSRPRPSQQFFSPADPDERDPPFQWLAVHKGLEQEFLAALDERLPDKIQRWRRERRRVR